MKLKLMANLKGLSGGLLGVSLCLLWVDYGKIEFPLGIGTSYVIWIVFILSIICYLLLTIRIEGKK